LQQHDRQRHDEEASPDGAERSHVPRRMVAEWVARHEQRRAHSPHDAHHARDDQEAGRVPAS
jgi:hypothetical protein